MEHPKPFLKWVGGKTQIIDAVLERFPKSIQNYYEPFLGGGSVLLALLSRKASGKITIKGKISASDLNSNLIGLYKNIQSKPDELIKKVKQLQDNFSACKGTIVNRQAKNIEEATSSRESYYFWIRAKFNNLGTSDSVRASAMLLFLNKTCFRGLYREGPNGFNVPYGNYTNPAIIDENHIRQISTLIKDVEFSQSPFQQALKNVTSGDFVYMDPPYAPENTNSFVSYGKDGFGQDNHNGLFQLCQTLTTKNVKMLMSNADVKLVKDSFPSPIYTTKIISCRRAINSKEPDARTNEVLINN